MRIELTDYAEGLRIYREPIREIAHALRRTAGNLDQGRDPSPERRCLSCRRAVSSTSRPASRFRPGRRRLLTSAESRSRSRRKHSGPIDDQSRCGDRVEFAEVLVDFDVRWVLRESR